MKGDEGIFFDFLNLRIDCADQKQNRVTWISVEKNSFQENQEFVGYIELKFQDASTIASAIPNFLVDQDLSAEIVLNLVFTVVLQWLEKVYSPSWRTSAVNLYFSMDQATI